jgi:hypothetical protein
MEGREACDDAPCSLSHTRREFKILRTVVLTLRSKVQGQGMNPFDAWNSILDMILALGTNHLSSALRKRARHDHTHTHTIHTLSFVTLRMN